MTKLKAILTSTLLFVSVMSFAQTGQGSFMLGGNFNFNIPTRDNAHNAELYLDPMAGIFIIDNWVLGLSIPMWARRDNDNVSRSSLGVVPFTRYYIPFSKLNLFFEGGLGVVTNSRRTRHNNHRESWSSTSGSLGVGLAYFITSNIGLEGIMQYQGHHYNDPLFRTREGFNISAGFSIYLPK